MTNGNFPTQNQPGFGPREGFNSSEQLTVFDIDLIGAEKRVDGANAQDPNILGIDALVRSLPGVKIRGYYDRKFPVVTFLYHKTGVDGELETAPRTVLVTGIYEGEHPDHAGQGKDAYLHGVQINDPNDDSGKLLVVGMDEVAISSNTKNFAFNSIYATGKTVVDARTGARQFIPANPLEV